MPQPSNESRPTAEVDPLYPQVLPPAADAEPLAEVLKRTGERASLAEGYEDGYAPAAQRRQGQVVADQPDYYGLPAIKRPEWKWYIPTYFLTGGMAAGSYITAALADAVGHEEDQTVVRAGRYLCLVMLGVSPILLIADLGRPERFHHMLRVFRPRSMMNQGSWALTIFGAFVGLAALAQVAEDWKITNVLKQAGSPATSPSGSGGDAQYAVCAGPSALRRLPMRLVQSAGILPAAFVGSYTGVLLSSTCVPLWAGNARFLGPLFLASAMSGGIAGTHFTARMLGPISPQSEDRLHTAETVCLAAEVALTAASAASLGQLAKPLVSGKMSKAFQLGYLGLGVAAPFLLSRFGKKRPWLRMLASVLSVAGTAMLKFAVTEGGKESADDPHAYFEYTKAEKP